MHVGFCIAPFGGHVNTSLVVVSELARRGHRVSYATTTEFSRPAREAGGLPVTYGAMTAAPPAGPAVASEPPDTVVGHDFAYGYLAQLRDLQAMLPVLIPAFAADPPDVIVCDPMTWAGRALAARFGVPHVNSVTTLITKARWSLGPVDVGFDPADPRLPRLFAATSAVLAGYRTGLTANQLLGTDGAVPTIVYYPRAFEPQGGEFGPDVCFAGPCLPSRPGGPRAAPGAGSEIWPPGDGPAVLVSLGTVFNRQPELFRRCIDAFAGTRCRVVAALGGMDPATLGPLPGNARAYSYLPLTEALGCADVLVGHAGMRSTMEALSLGVPVVALPQMPEQHVNASRLADLGLGRCLELGQQTPAAVRQAVTAILDDDRIRPRLDWMRAEIERAPGAPAAAKAVENAPRNS
jgi:demethyllactenocin mycarosyltransferase